MTFGPVSSGAAPSRPGAGRSATSRCFHSGMLPALSGVVQYAWGCEVVPSLPPTRYSAPLAPQPEAFVRATGRLALLLIAHALTRPSSGFGGWPGSAGGLTWPGWSAPTGLPLAPAAPYSHRLLPVETIVASVTAVGRPLTSCHFLSVPCASNGAWKTLPETPSGPVPPAITSPVAVATIAAPALGSGSVSASSAGFHSPREPVSASGVRTNTVSVGLP